MNVTRSLKGLILAALVSGSVQGADCLPRITSAWVRAAPPGAASLAGYLVLRNDCAAPVTVRGVESRDFGMPMIHRSVIEAGMSRMRAVGALTVPAGAELRFEPGGLHLMLMQPLRPLAEGDVARLRLVLGDGRRVYAELPVRRLAP